MFSIHGGALISDTNGRVGIGNNNNNNTMLLKIDNEAGLTGTLSERRSVPNKSKLNGVDYTYTVNMGTGYGSTRFWEYAPVVLDGISFFIRASSYDARAKPHRMYDRDQLYALDQPPCQIYISGDSASEAGYARPDSFDPGSGNYASNGVSSTTVNGSEIKGAFVEFAFVSGIYSLRPTTVIISKGGRSGLDRRCPQLFYVVGYRNGVWETIYQQTAALQERFWASNPACIINVNNTNYYTSFRMITTRIGGNGYYVEISNFQVFGDLRTVNKTDTTNGLCYRSDGLIGINKPIANIANTLDIGGTLNCSRLLLGGGPVVIPYINRLSWKGVRLTSVFTKPPGVVMDIIIHGTLQCYVQNANITIFTKMDIQSSNSSPVVYSKDNVFSRYFGTNTNLRSPISFSDRIPHSSLPAGIYDITFSQATTSNAFLTDDDCGIYILICMAS